MRPSQLQLSIRPQAAQERFLSCPADIVIFGGAAGGGKSWALLFEALRHKDNQGFTATIFRRTYPEIMAVGGLWAESMLSYPYFGAKPNATELSWKFPKGGVVKFGHLQFENDVRKYLGSQICYLGFDQLETFSQEQFFYLMSRNRSTCGVRPYIRATANPEPGWLADLLSWWIDQDSGFPLPDRDGVIRWFHRDGDEIKWGNSRLELIAEHPTALPKSITFIRATLEDNEILMQADPGYLANLRALPYIEQQRLLHGNWKISNVEGEWPPEYFGNWLWYGKDQCPKEIICSVLACDPSKGVKEAKFGDYCAFVLVKVAKDLSVWTESWLGRWTTTEICERALQLYREHNPTGVVFEINGFQQMLAEDFQRLCISRGVFPRVWGITNMEPKPVRIRRLGPILAQHNLHLLAEQEGGKLLLGQMQTFGPKNPDLHDDGPDSLEMGIRMANWLLNGGDDGMVSPIAIAA